MSIVALSVAVILLAGSMLFQSLKGLHVNCRKQFVMIGFRLVGFNP
jgi:hypothetical protein